VISLTQRRRTRAYPVNSCSTTSEEGIGFPGSSTSGDDIDLNCDFENGNFEITETDIGISLGPPFPGPPFPGFPPLNTKGNRSETNLPILVF
jgi:hypothetical protein